jgi:hypothetical protein
MSDLFSDVSKVERLINALPTITAQAQTVLADLQIAIKRAQELVTTIQETVE